MERGKGGGMSSGAEIHALARDLGLLPSKLVRKVEAVVPKTGLAMKKRMQADFRSSEHFKPVARSVDYEVIRGGFGGDSVIKVEVGPNKERASSASLANIAYFGSSRSGGATVPDPVVPMRLEAPVFFGFMEMATEGLL